MENKYSTYFEYGVLTSKIVMLITLIAIAFINADMSFITPNPRDFLAESFFVGLGTALPMILLSYNREGSITSTFNITFMSFLVFFIFNVLVEMCGLNNSMNDTNTKQLGDQRQQALIGEIKNQYWLYGVIGVIGLALMYLAYNVWDFSLPLVPSILEIIVFAGLNSIPQGVIASHRGGNVPYAVGSSFAMFSVGYVILQCGGFFTGLFKE